MGYVYKITNTVNGKAYIGISIREPEKGRVREHLCFLPNFRMFAVSRFTLGSGDGNHPIRLGMPCVVSFPPIVLPHILCLHTSPQSRFHIVTAAAGCSRTHNGTGVVQILLLLNIE